MTLLAPGTYAATTCGGNPYPGKGDCEGNSSNPKVVVDGDVDGYVFGVPLRSGTATEAEVTIKSGTVTGDVEGGYVDVNGTAKENTVIIEGGTMKSYVTGGSVMGDGTATKNTVTIKGGTIWDTVHGGYVSGTGDATGNTVELLGGTIKGSVYGGYAGSGKDSSNILKVGAKVIVGEDGGMVTNFDQLVFTLPSDIAADDIMLDAKRHAFFPANGSIDPTTVTIEVPNPLTTLKAGDVITLIKAAGNFEITSYATTPTDVTAGNYTFAVSTTTDKRLIAKVKTAPHAINIDPTITNGTVECNSGAATVADGGKVSCTATPTDATTHELEMLTITGGTATKACDASPCELADVKGDVTVTATFKSIIPAPTYHNIYTSTSGNGTVVCNGGANQVEDGREVNCSATADTGSTLKTLKITDGKWTETCDGPRLSCSVTLPSVSNTVVVTATFALITYTVDVKADPAAGGNVDCGGVTTVNHGDPVSCTITLNTGFTWGDLSALMSSPPAGVTCSKPNETTVKCDTTGAIEDIIVTIPFVDAGSGSGTGNGGGNGSGGGTDPGTGGGDPGTGTDPGTGGGDPGTGGGDPGTGTGGGYSGGGNSSSPTMGDLGLLLSSLALAGAAAPALRRREKQGKRADTRQ